MYESFMLTDKMRSVSFSLKARIDALLIWLEEKEES